MVFLSIIDKFHNYFMSQMFEWCSSYAYVSISMWLCIAFLIYLTITMLLKAQRYYKNKKDIVEKICAAIEEHNAVECIRYLERYPQCVNAFSANGYTPFLVACANGNTQIVKLMLKRGADIRLKSKNNESPFYLATFYYIRYPQFKNATCIRELYYAGADVDEPNDKGLTPLQMAAMFGHTALVKWLLTKNACGKVIPDPYIIATSQGFQDTAAVIWKMTKGFAIEFKD